MRPWPRRQLACWLLLVLYFAKASRQDGACNAAAGQDPSSFASQFDALRPDKALALWGVEGDGEEEAEEAPPEAPNTKENAGVLEVAIGVISSGVSEASRARRQAIRDTWMTHRPPVQQPGGMQIHVTFKFFLGLSRPAAAAVEGGSSSSSSSSRLRVPSAVTEEEQQFGDILVVGVEETYANIYYKAIAVFRWGAMDCSADFVFRINDDNFVLLAPLLHSLSSIPPQLVYAGYFLEGVRVCRPDSADQHRRSLCPSREDYPSDEYPLFAQGNVVVLSGDLAYHVGELSQQPWCTPLPDDVSVALVALAHRPFMHDIPASFAPDQAPIECNPNALLHMDLDVETMYRMGDLLQQGRNPCEGTPPWRAAP